MDETEAIAELQCLSKNAKDWIEDRVGNWVSQVSLYSGLGSAQKAEKAADALLHDLQRVGCFEMQRLTSIGQSPLCGAGKEKR